MSERKLQKCMTCGEWFNTTDEIMKYHRKKCAVNSSLFIKINCGTKALEEAFLKLKSKMNIIISKEVAKLAKVVSNRF